MLYSHTIESKRLTYLKSKLYKIADARYPEMIERGHTTTKSENRLQWVVGGCAEEAVRACIINHYKRPCSDIDLKLRTKEERKILGYNPDLVSGTIDFEVKCDNYEAYSWVLGPKQVRDILEDDYLYQRKMIALVHKVSENQYDVVGIYPMLRILREGYLGPPRQKSKEGKKICLYMKDQTIRGKFVKGIENFNPRIKSEKNKY